jgi:hypothetical protein
MLTLLLLFVIDYARPCSMFKITLFGKTMVGNNEDAWRVILILCIFVSGL